MNTPPSISVRNGSAVETPAESAQRIGGALLLVYVWWFLIYFDPHYMLARYIGGGVVLKRIPVLLLVPLLVVLFQRGGFRSIYWPLLLFTAVHFVAIFGAGNRGLAFTGFKTMLFFLIAFTATIALVRTGSQALTLCRLFLLSFPWFFLQGLPRGSVPWHGWLANTDAFGPFGVMGMGFGYFFALGAKEKKWRYLGFGIALLGAAAFVASFARGAFVGAVIVSCHMWLRSPRKVLALGAGIAGAAIVMVTAEVIFPAGSFWTEMKTIAAGTKEGTGESRWIIWTQVGIPVFLERPIFGVGAYNTGVVATRIIAPGTIPGRWSQPDRLYNKAIHNVYVQILAEEGAVGLLLWLGMLFDFFRRVNKMSKKSARAIWDRGGGSAVDLRCLAFGLESAMIGFLVCGIFYNQAYRHWFYTLVLLSIVLSNAVRNSSPSGRGRTQLNKYSNFEAEPL